MKMWFQSLMIIFGILEFSEADKSCTKTHYYYASRYIGERISFDARYSHCNVYNHDIIIDDGNENEIIELKWKSFKIHGNMPECNPSDDDGERVTIYTG